ncbi:MAG: rRNA pseudouridine synthase [Magnetospirillum sp. WYHS-4]
MSDEKKGERLAKVVARAGLCSRRDAESWIAAGRISVNGTVVATPAINVGAGDVILVDGKPLPEAGETRLWRYNKPAGLVTTHKDPQGRPTVFQKLPAGMPRVVSVGRLDLNSEGLLLLTTDGELARDLELPSRNWTRRYRVRVHGAVDEDALKNLRKGITIEGIKYGPVLAHLEREQGSNAWVSLSIHEGKNREVRRIMEHLGLQVTRLIRVSYGPFQLGNLERGQVDEVPRRVLRDQLGRGKVKAAPGGRRTKAPADEGVE